jgi:radical SAM protein with 4Fe4S-binding SPASM domain
MPGGPSGYISVARNFLSYYTGAVAPLPIGYFTIGITHRCGLRCRMCNIWRRPGEEGAELGCGTWIRRLEKTRLLGRRGHVSITGGEPFLKPGFGGFLRDLLRLPRVGSVSIATGGTLTERIAADVRGAMEGPGGGGRLCVSISLDAAGDLHDEIRGRKGVFAAVERTIDALGGLSREFPGLSMLACCTLQPLNIDRIEGLEEFCRGKSLPCHFSIIQQAPNLFNLDSDYSAKAFTGAQRRRVREIAGFPGIDRWFDPAGKRPLRCFAGYSSIYINPSGGVYPCVTMAGMEEFLMGSIADVEIDDVWSSPRAWKARRAVKRCGYTSCWSGCELDATLCQWGPVNRLVRRATMGWVDPYRILKLV